MMLAGLIDNICAPFPVYQPKFDRHANKIPLITAYFKQSYSNKDILRCLAVSHGIIMSLASLKGVLLRLKLRKRVPLTEEIACQAIHYIQGELQKSGQMLGYKTMWKRLHQQGIIIGRDTVREMLLHLDSDGVRERARRRLARRRYINPGPNFVWHVDGYDKLKPYGFAIHGAIDGYSRRILWLEVGVSNNNPKVTVQYYLETVMQLQTVPCIVRADHGTENVHIRDVQVHLRDDFEDDFCGTNSFMQGRSCNNQRIEAWWGILRKQCVQFWMNLFKDMIAIGMHDTSDPIHVHAIRFCFMDLIEMEIHRTATEWNQHLIETKKNAESPRGKPDIMYFHPRIYNTESYGCDFDNEEVFHMQHELVLGGCIEENHDPYSFIKLINEIMPDWKIPADVDSGLQLYADILDRISEY